MKWGRNRLEELQNGWYNSHSSIAITAGDMSISEDGKHLRNSNAHPREPKASVTFLEFFR